MIAIDINLCSTDLIPSFFFLGFFACFMEVLSCVLAFSALARFFPDLAMVLLPASQADTSNGFP